MTLIQVVYEHPGWTFMTIWLVGAIIVDGIKAWRAK